MSIALEKMATALRVLSMDIVENARSGHPGMPMGMAEIAVALWHLQLAHNPCSPTWPNRDRFVVSNGHGSALLYALLHLTGYNLSLAELKNFRQLHSKTAGHPEYGLTVGVETTTGPLGQGLANAVGMALAERLLAEEFNRPGHSIIDHRTYVFLGDGCLMEGISHEVCSLAGTWKLNKLIAIWDNNQISIDGKVDAWFNDNTAQRFKAYGWNVIKNVDGHDIVAVNAALQCAQASIYPTLIDCKTTIAKGSPHKQGSHHAHGAPLGAEEIAATRKNLNWQDPPFFISPEIYAAWDAKKTGATRETQWQEKWQRYQDAFPQQAAELQRRWAQQLPATFEAEVRAHLNQVQQTTVALATRRASQHTIEFLANLLPELLGGSADLTDSNLTSWAKSQAVSATQGGNYIHYGVREFGMSAIINGIVLHGGFLPYAGTFLTFSDYSRNALRMAALMKIGSIFVFTHDSIGLGEDGPTHQPIEHLSSLRLIPNLDLWRPADRTETCIAWHQAVKRRDGPTCLVFSRQNLPSFARNQEQIDSIHRGAYILYHASEHPDALILATGSEVQIAMTAAQDLAQHNIALRVISMPSTTVFDRQDTAYQARILPKNIPRIAIEAGVRDFWSKYACAAAIGMDCFGESAPGDKLFEHFGFTKNRVIETVKHLIHSS